MIHRIHKQNNFTILPNALLRDKSLSFKARGMLAMVLTNSEEWETTRNWLIGQGPDGKSAVQSAVNELKEHGYLRIDPIRSGDGTIKNWIWHWLESPEIHPDPENQTPEVRNPAGGYPEGGNRGLSEDHLSEGPSEKNKREPSSTSRKGNQKEDSASSLLDRGEPLPTDKIKSMISKLHPDWEALKTWDSVEERALFSGLEVLREMNKDQWKLVAAWVRARAAAKLWPWNRSQLCENIGSAAQSATGWDREGRPAFSPNGKKRSGMSL